MYLNIIFRHSKTFAQYCTGFYNFWFQALLKLDCQGLVAQLVKDFALLTAAVEVSDRWRDLAEKLAKVSRKQMDAYEAPYRGPDGVIDNEVWSKNTHKQNRMHTYCKYSTK